MKTLLCALVFIAMAALSVAKTIHVPGDSTTIQAGINGAVSGDTVLVQPGIYVENIFFQGLEIVMGSLFLTTGDTSYVSQTVVDGGASGSVVTFHFYEDSATVLTGFTIQNGLSVRGGGIFCDYSAPTISNNHIVSNLFDARDSIGYGAGIYCRHSQPRIINNEICDNSYLGTSHSYAGGIYCESSDPQIKGNHIFNNRSGNVGGGICMLNSSGLIEGNTISGNYSRYGGAISCGANSSPTIASNVIYDNDAVTGDGLDIFGGSSPIIVNNSIVDNDYLGIFWDDSDPVITNTIVWGNGIFGRGSATITYCDIQGGYEGNGNIEADPLFRDPDNGDFHLMASDCGDPYDSPCIDMGHPDYVDRFLDCQWGHGSNQADMGAYGGNARPVMDVEDYGPVVPESFILMQNYPNPFNMATKIEYNLPERTHVSIVLVNVLGQRIRTLVDEEKSVGRHSITWDGKNSSSRLATTGVYFYRFQAGDYVETRKMLLLK